MGEWLLYEIEPGVDVQANGSDGNWLWPFLAFVQHKPALTKQFLHQTAT
jgi:hypothetical protein